MFFQEKTVSRWLMLLWFFFLQNGDGVASQDVTVTVHPGKDHVFRGFGVNHTTWRDPAWFGVPQEIVDSIVEIVFSPEKMGFNSLRLFTHPTAELNAYGETKQMDGDLIGEMYSRIYRTVKDYQPDINFLFCPWQRGSCPIWGKVQDDMRGYVERKVEIARIMKEDYGITWNASGVFNEPQNDPELVDDKHIAELVLMFREEFDRQGMPEVKIIAPECSNVLDWKPPDPKGAHTAMVDSIIANAAALEALHGWGYHTYNYGAAKWFRDKVWPTGKELWQTESGIHGREGGEKEIHHAAQQAAIILSDINLLASYWFFFLDMSPENFVYDSSANFFNEALTLHRITNRPGEGWRVRSWLKNDYIGRLTRSFKPDTWMRFCTSNLVPWMRNDVNRFIYMENTNRDISGELSQICAAAGRRPDSSWILAAVNRTGLPGIDEDTVWDADGNVAWMKHQYAPADSFMVTFDVAELRESGDITFQVTRCNQENRCLDDGTLSMSNGLVTVPTAATELVTLESEGGIPITSARSLKGRLSYSGSYAVRNTGRVWRFSLAGAGKNGAKTAVDIFNSRGRRVVSLISVDGSAVEWDGRGRRGVRAAPGMYNARISNGRVSHVAAIYVTN